MKVTPYQIIEKKRDGIPLTEDEIKFFINGLLNGEVADYQMSAFLMATYLKGMNTEETFHLTKTMLDSGKSLPKLGENCVDKHSTGGIGDKTSFIIGPIAAACGVTVPMVAGRGLGFTGGTIDKVEAIEGFQTSVDLQDMKIFLEKNSFVLSGQTDDIAPADKIIYSLRDVTATIDSIELITASILSKKLAEGISGLVMDLKYGTGAFMKKVENSEKLANSMARVARKFGVSTMMFITDMNQPLGRFAGHSHEIIESIQVLKGEGVKELHDLCVNLAAGMIYLGKKADSFEKAKEMAESSIKDGSAFKLFKEFIIAQGGKDFNFEAPEKSLDIAPNCLEIKSIEAGYLNHIDNKEIGFMLIDLGAGRRIRSDKIDFGVGIEFPVKLGDKIDKGDTLCKIFHRDEQQKLVQNLEESFLKNVIKIEPNRKVPPKLIEKVITDII